MLVEKKLTDYSNASSTNIWERAIYIQVILDKLNTLHINIRNQVIASMLATSQTFEKRSFTILLAASILVVLGTLIGMIVISKMKKTYLK